MKNRVFAVLLFGVSFYPLSFTYSQTHKVVVLSDMNGGYGSAVYDRSVHDAVKETIRMQPDFVLTTGDLVGGQSRSLSNSQIQKMWKSFHQTVTEPLANHGLDFFVSPGNHDASGYPGYERERDSFSQEWIFRKPKSVQFIDSDHYPFRYAFEAKGALFVALDVTREDALNGEQYDWLENVLRKNQHYNLKILFGHFPLFPFAEQGRENDYLKNGKLESLMNEYGVSLYLSGHHHAYYPGKRGDLRLVGTSCQGGGPRKLIGSPVVSPKSIVVVEFNSEKILGIEAFSGSEFRSKVDRTTLPEWIQKGTPLEIKRDDL